MVLENILLLYASLFVLLFLHELAKAPENLNVSFKNFLPVIKSNNNKFVYGHLIVDVIVLLGVFFYQPQSFLIQIFGLVTWIHLIATLVIGSVVSSDHKGVFPNVDDKDFYIALPLALLVFALQSNYYLEILKTLF